MFLSAPSALMTVTLGQGHRILKMLKFSFKFLRPHYFLTLSPIWFIFGLMKILHSAIPNPAPPPPPPPPPPHFPHPGHVKIMVTDLEFSRNKMCNVRQAVLSGDKSCLLGYNTFRVHL